MIRPLSEIEREAILAAIRELHDIPRAARALGIGRNTAYRKLREYGIPLYRPPGFKVLRARKPAIHCPDCNSRMRASETRRFYGHLMRHGWMPAEARKQAFVRKTDCNNVMAP